jgi:hypothetical protein
MVILKDVLLHSEHNSGEKSSNAIVELSNLFLYFRSDKQNKRYERGSEDIDK